jgi:hypothetical protein
MRRSLTLVLATVSLVGAIAVATTGSRPRELYLEPGLGHPVEQALAARP